MVAQVCSIPVELVLECGTEYQCFRLECYLRQLRICCLEWLSGAVSHMQYNRRKGSKGNYPHRLWQSKSEYIHNHLLGNYLSHEFFNS